MMMKRLVGFFLITLTSSIFSPVFASDDVTIEEVKDFSKLGEHSREKRLPILLMFSAKHCTYCVRLEEDFLKPMLRSGDYEDKILIRKIKIDSFGAIRDFKGEQATAGEIADRYKIYVTPTVVFIDGDGVQLAKKRVGLTTPDFYGGYLDQSIDIALDVLRRNKPMRVKLSAVNN
jgi:thioredoxin-related protein